MPYLSRANGMMLEWHLESNKRRGMNESEDKSRHRTGTGTHLPDYYKLKNDKEQTLITTNLKMIRKKNILFRGVMVRVCTHI